MLIALGLIFLIRGVLSVLLPAVADESYYMMWSHHLSLAYVDHPGMVAWLLAGMRVIIPDTFIAARVLSVLIYAATVAILYVTIRDLGKRPATALTMAMAFMLIPYHFVVGITYQVEQPLILGGALAIWGWVRLIKTGQNRYFYWIALSLAAILNTKLTGGLLVIGFVILVALVPKRWPWLKRPHFWGSIFLVLLAMAPFLFWQQTHGWISFLFHVKRVGETHWFEHFFEFIGNQLLYVSPVLIAWFWMAIWRRPRSEIQRDMIILAAIVWIPFALLSIKTQVYPHWPIIATIPMIIAIADLEFMRLKNWIIGMSVFSALVIGVLLVVQPSFLRPEVRHNRVVIPEIQARLQQAPSDIKILSDFHGSVGILSDSLGRPVAMTQVLNATGPRWGEVQIGIWESSEIKKGGSALLWIDPTPEAIALLNQSFKTVSESPSWNLTVLEPQISSKKMFWCEDARSQIRL